jgi:hypothetical protein
MEMSHFSIATLTLDKCIFLLGDLDTCIILYQSALEILPAYSTISRVDLMGRNLSESQVITIPKKYLRSYDSEVDSGH